MSGGAYKKFLRTFWYIYFFDTPNGSRVRADRGHYFEIYCLVELITKLKNVNFCLMTFFDSSNGLRVRAANSAQGGDRVSKH